METATIDGEPPEGMIRVQVFMKAEGHLDMFMTKEEYEGLVDEDGDEVYGGSERIVEAAGDDLLNALEWEIEMAEECQAPKKKAKSG